MTSNETVTLLPCKRCGEDDGLVYANGGMYGVECQNCGFAVGPKAFEADAIAAWNTRSKPVAGAVKPLEWKECATYKGAGFDIADHRRLGVAYAETPIGTYVIVSGPANLYEAWFCSGQVSGAYKTKDEAKAAAEADYRQRILSCIDLSPQGEPVAWVNEETFRHEMQNDYVASVYPDRSAAENTALYLAPQPAAISEEKSLLDLVREEASKDNSPIGRSDGVALRNIRVALGLDPWTGAAFSREA